MKKRNNCLPKGVYLRGHTYYIDISINGERIRRSAGKTLQGALTLLARLDSTTDEASKRPSARTTGPVFDQLSKRYLTRAALYSKPSSLQSAETSCRRLLEHFGGRRVSSLQPHDLERFLAARLETVTRAAVNRDLRYLKAIFRLASDEDLIDEPPFKVTLLRTTKKLPSILTVEELNHLFEVADDRLRPLLITAAMTGLRHSELSALDWSDIDLKSGSLSVRAKPEIGFSPKSHAERQVPLNDRLTAILGALRSQLTHSFPHHPVFQRNRRTGSRWDPSALCATVRAAFKKADLYRPEDRPGLHMLRRSFASHALARQTDIQTVRELGGWSCLAVVERYVTSTEQLKRTAVARLDFLEEAAD